MRTSLYQAPRIAGKIVKIGRNKGIVHQRRSRAIEDPRGYVCYVFSENVGNEWHRRTSLARSHGCTPRLADSVRRRYSPRTDALRLPTFLHVDSTQEHVRRVVTKALQWTRGALGRRHTLVARPQEAQHSATRSPSCNLSAVRTCIFPQSVSVCTYDGKFVGMLWVLALARVKGSPLKAPHLGEYITVVRKVPAMWGTGPSEPQGSYKRPCPGAAVMVRRPEALSGPGTLGAGAGPPEASSGRKGRLPFEGRGTRAPTARYIRSHWGRECGPVARATSTSLYQASGSGWKKSRN
ncbi:Acyl-CoA synthetase member 2 mitochondrial [Branchiostoma belcheri]|nr:Acyl-CoA synthetase member 2 mitochondrial [Branchiostoma belcheri]